MSLIEYNAGGVGKTTTEMHFSSKLVCKRENNLYAILQTCKQEISADGEGMGACLK